jgi:pantetheine hydrolase
LNVKQDVDIIVFPEDGIHGVMVFTNRASLESYTEYIPDPNLETWTPCEDPARHNNTEVQHFLSCLARNNSLYLVANMADRQPCSVTKDNKCRDGRYQFNTNVVYNPNGTLIARYHKEHLFKIETRFFDKPESVNLVTFDTHFGKFGVFTCFDILFRSPAIDLLEKYGVTNVVFPTAWMDVLPFFPSVEFHSAFAAGMGVNFLAANIHYPTGRFHGSGIYTPDGAEAYYYNDTGSEGRLLIATIQVIKKANFADQSLFAIRETDVQEPDFKSDVSVDTFHFVKLKSSEGNITVCHNQLCCSLNYVNFGNANNDDVYAFGAFDGLHNVKEGYYLQICTLLKCANKTETSCGSPTKVAQTTFQHVRISGNFSRRYVFPELLVSNHGSLELVPKQQWRYADGIIQSEAGIELPLLSATLFGRVYDRDDDGLGLISSSMTSRAASVTMVIGLLLLHHVTP